MQTAIYASGGDLQVRLRVAFFGCARRRVEIRAMVLMERVGSSKHEALLERQSGSWVAENNNMRFS